MIVDSSALGCILLDEPEAPGILGATHSAQSRSMAAPNWLETSIVFDGRMIAASYGRLEIVVALATIEIAPFDARHAAIARDANLRFGKNRHPAKLNFGDCIAYALAKHTGEPLLFKGDDFAQTDFIPALAA